MKKGICMFLLVYCTFLLAGCFKGAADLTINEDGSVKAENTIAAIDLMQGAMDELKNETVNRNKNAKIESYKEGNLSGYKIIENYDSIGDFARNGAELYGQQEGRAKGVQEVKGWFFDAYAFDFFKEGDKEKSDDPDVQAMAKAMMSQVKFDFTINLPYPADNHNADQVSNENKTLYWNLAGTLTSDLDKSMQVQFKIWHKDHVIMTGIVAGILLLLTIAYGLMALKAEEGSERQGKGIVAVIAFLLLLALGAVSAYMVMAPPKFTNDTIITPKVVVKEQKNESNPSAPKVERNKQEPKETKRVVENTNSVNKVNPLGLGRVSLGDSESSLDSLGKPDKRTVRDDGRADYEYADIEVHCKGGKVHTLVSNSPMVSTPKGIHEQSSLQDVLDAYGNGYLKSQYDNLDLYEYKMSDDMGSPCMLRFAINPKNQRVKYISIRHL